MSIKEEIKDSGYLTSCGTKWINSLFCFPVKRSQLSSYIRFVEDFLGAAASLETSSENPAAWRCCMKASMCAAGMTSSPRCNLVETTYLGGMAYEGDELIYTVVLGVGNMVGTATRGAIRSFCVCFCTITEKEIDSVNSISQLWIMSGRYN